MKKVLIALVTLLFIGFMLIGYIQGQEHNREIQKPIIPENRVVGTWEYKGTELIPYNFARNESIKDDFTFTYIFNRDSSYNLTVINKLKYPDGDITENSFVITGIYSTDGDYITLEPQRVMGKSEEELVKQLKSQNSLIQVPNEGLREFRKYEMVFKITGNKLTFDSQDGNAIVYTKK